MTIAFSEKYGFWTTRYSFEPTCYASVDNEFLSSKASEGVWVHDDPDADRNSFYGDGYASEILISSNQDPSAIKFYKSVSVETNAENITADVSTNEEYSGKERQAGSITSFDNKEGFKYAEMPRDVQNSSSNIFNCKEMYVSSLFSDNPTGTDISADGFVFLTMYSPGSNLPVSSQLKTVVDGVFVDPDWGDFLGLEENPFPETYVFKNTSIQTTLALRVSDAIIDEASNIESDLQGLLNSKLLLVFGSAILTFLSTISDGESLPDEIAAAADPVASTELTTLNPFKVVEGENITEYKLAGVTNSIVDGDQMRGPYAKVRINISDTTPFELHAINVDYSFSKLDARLTQNS
jgi:hypothetical protein